MTKTALDPVAIAIQAFTTPRKRPASVEDVQSTLGATRRTINFSGQELVTWTWGKGQPVLLLHGWESRGSHMAGFVPSLLKSGLSPIALDAPAHGDSEGGTTDAVHYGRAVLALADEVGPLKAIIGHSLGSAAALYAFAHGTKVNASVHICGPSSMTGVVRRSAKLAGLDASEVSKFEAMLSDQIGAPISTMDLSALSVGMIHPALIFHDPEDSEMPIAESIAVADAWKGSTLSLIADVGHRRILRSATVIQSAVDFISNIDLKR